MPGATVDPISASIQATLGGINAGLGLINSAKAKKEAEFLKRTRPVRTTSQEAIDQEALAKSELAQGMSAEAEAAYEGGIDRDLSTSIDAILKGGGSVNNIGDLFENSNEARQKLSIMKDNLRLNQINNLVRAQTNMQGEEDQNFFYNQVKPWTDASQANAEARKAASSQIWSGVNSFGAGVMNAANETQTSNQLNDYFNVPYKRTTDQSQFGTAPVLNPLSNYSSQTIDNPLNRTPSLNIGGNMPNRNQILGPMPYGG